jgi:hypothetical protein
MLHDGRCLAHAALTDQDRAGRGKQFGPGKLPPVWTAQYTNHVAAQFENLIQHGFPPFICPSIIPAW